VKYNFLFYLAAMRLPDAANPASLVGEFEDRARRVGGSDVGVESEPGDRVTESPGTNEEFKF
jgi:hypothetical protein